MATRSPALMALPPSWMSSVAVRDMCASGVCQRMVSDTIEVISEGSARSLAYSPGFLFRA